jgi:NAD(P)-dependent dehydrogenase (short-subunit alcohol dehydrogenase family)
LNPVADRPAFTLITGASSGLGRALALRLGPSRPLILCGRRIEALQATLAQAGQTFEHCLWPFDLDEVDGIEAAIRSLLQERGIRVDALVHSAGIAEIMPLKTTKPAIARSMMNVNLLSALELCRVLSLKRINGPTLRQIVLISSTSSRIGEKGASAYCASKGAVDALVRSLAVELAPAVRVNSVLPGIMLTEMSEHWVESPSYRAMRDRFPLGFGTPEDVVGVVEFLLSDSARWLNGQQITIDGGRTIT